LDRILWINHSELK